MIAGIISLPKAWASSISFWHSTELSASGEASNMMAWQAVLALRRASRAALAGQYYANHEDVALSQPLLISHR